MVIVDPTDASEDSKLYIKTLVAGVQTISASFQAGVSLGAVAGGDKGVGTLNATELYENNVTLDAKYASLALANTFTNHLTMNGGNFIYGTSNFILSANTADAADNKRIIICGGGGASTARGAYIALQGNEYATDAGKVVLSSSVGISLNGAADLTSLLVGAATGGNKGAGTVNAVGVYDDNVLLTCMPLQEGFLAGGGVDLDYWDTLAPGGRHGAAHRFAELLEAGVDPRDPDGYVDAMRAAQALPGMPSFDDWEHGELSTGEMLSRLWLAVEMLAVAWMSERGRAPVH